MSRVGRVGVGMKFKKYKENSHKCSVHHQAAAVVLVGAVKGVLCDVFLYFHSRTCFCKDDAPPPFFLSVYPFTTIIIKALLFFTTVF